MHVEFLGTVSPKLSILVYQLDRMQNFISVYAKLIEMWIYQKTIKQTEKHCFII